MKTSTCFECYKKFPRSLNCEGEENQLCPACRLAQIRTPEEKAAGEKMLAEFLATPKVKKDTSHSRHGSADNQSNPWNRGKWE